ncbi:MAG: aldose 1-epimerase [Lentimonas sp.]|jgi:aldose 1-epimerase
MSISSRPFGPLPDNSSATLFTLKNSQGLSAEITNYGGIIVALYTPDRNGQMTDITLGKDSLEAYLAGHPYFGPITGRVAGRISGAQFTLEGQNYTLAANNGPNCLHGGLKGFDQILWDAEVVEQDGQQKLQLKITDPDGSNGFPGTLECTVTYALLEDNSLEITYAASTDKTTPLNLTNHAYFNLSGQGSGDVLGHEVQIHASSVASIDADATLLGRRDPVVAGFNDFRAPVLLKSLPELVPGNADIHYFLDKGRSAIPEIAAQVYDPSSGRVLETLTTEPGVQFYASMSLPADGSELGKAGVRYLPSHAFCLETQDYADSVNCPELGNALLRPGQRFESTTLYRFSTR